MNALKYGVWAFLLSGLAALFLSTGQAAASPDQPQDGSGAGKPRAAATASFSSPPRASAATSSSSYQMQQAITNSYNPTAYTTPSAYSNQAGYSTPSTTSTYNGYYTNPGRPYTYTTPASPYVQTSTTSPYMPITNDSSLKSSGFSYYAPYGTNVVSNSGGCYTSSCTISYANGATYSTARPSSTSYTPSGSNGGQTITSTNVWYTPSSYPNTGGYKPPTYNGSPIR